METDTFLDAQELVRLTGWRIKSKQIEELRTMGLPFFINGAGKPVVCRSVIEGGKPVEQKKAWSPRALRTA